MLILDPVSTSAITKKTLTLCWCWLITRTDGAQLGFTGFDQMIAIGGVTYQSFTGFDSTADQVSEGLERLDSQNLKGILDVAVISKVDLQSGIYAKAQVRRFIVDYTNLPSSFSLNPPKHIELPTGYLADFTSNNLGYEIKVKSNLSLLENNVGTTTGKTCRAHLGDDVCTKDLTNFTHLLAVTNVVNRRVFSVNGGLPDKHLDRGRLYFTSGANNGVHLDIDFYVGSQIILFEQAPFNIAVGDNLTALAGCNKTKLACITKFQNFYYFDGEPDIPTTDLAIETPTK
ncbi:DUF2163 domain-containing protein [Pleurocapsa sp. FMAR1]|uniref:DUF2163 domain-containing protein n=1 Tax=Pleurocapsa sp. FMAR1 TaxID=3040204 RepID=UPI0029C8AE24|nr:DUF2163 domain-containing protein [Pleurocapsa sp. FMAR1]